LDIYLNWKEEGIIDRQSEPFSVYKADDGTVAAGSFMPS
jgi:hypothetical protein